MSRDRSPPQQVGRPKIDIAVTDYIASGPARPYGNPGGAVDLSVP